MIEKKFTEKSIINNPNNLSDQSLDSVSGGKLFIGRTEQNNINMQNSHNTDNSKTVFIGDGSNVTIGGKLDM